MMIGHQDIEEGDVAEPRHTSRIRRRDYRHRRAQDLRDREPALGLDGDDRLDQELIAPAPAGALDGSGRVEDIQLDEGRVGIGRLRLKGLLGRVPRTHLTRLCDAGRPQGQSQCHSQDDVAQSGTHASHLSATWTFHLPRCRAAGLRDPQREPGKSGPQGRSCRPKSWPGRAPRELDRRVIQLRRRREASPSDHQIREAPRRGTFHFWPIGLRHLAESRMLLTGVVPPR